MNQKIETYIEELRQTVTVAGLNYEVWWTFKEKESRKKHVDTMNTYSMFFQTAIHAHFVALLVSLYTLYEKRKDTVNIPQLISMLEKYHPLPKETETKIKKLHERAAPLWKKVAFLRNAAFGHRSNKLSVSEVFKNVGVKPDELKELCEVTKKLMNEITHTWDRSTHAFNLGSRKATERMLNDLGELKQVRSKKSTQNL